MKNYNSKFKTCKFYAAVLHLPLRTLSFSFLVFCLPASAGRAEISSEQLDPINLIAPYLAKISQDVNTPNTVMHVATFQQERQSGRRLTAKQSQSGSDIASVNFAAQIDEKLPQSSFTIAGNPHSDLERQLWRAGISIPESKEDEGGKNELQRIIEQIRSVEFKPANRPTEPAVVVEPTPITENDEISAVTETETAQGPDKIESELPYNPVSGQTLHKLENLSQYPDRLDNPLKLGEVLFLSGRLKEAVVFYKDALKRKSPNEADSAPLWGGQDRAWILFQIGNCMRDRDRPTAMKMYRRLITEYPDSPWTDLAKARNKLIDWYQKDKPRELIVENRDEN